jgi:hypothetical protein
MPDRGVARIERQHRTAALRDGDRQVAEPAAVVEHPAMDMGQRHLLERIQPQVRLAKPALQLPVEETDAGVRDRHRKS